MAALPIPSLLPQHLANLRASGLTDSIIAARGYYSESDTQKLIKLGFAESQAICPTMVIPLYGVDGDCIGYQHRPDIPRLNDSGKPIKYETPAGFAMRLDVHPALRENIANPAVDLYITEGIKKVDACMQHGGCCVGLLGVWNFRGRNIYGGIAELPDWGAIPLNGRTVRVVFDSDVTEKDGVRRALAALVAMLRRKGAKPEILLLPGDDGKVGLDDYLAKGGKLELIPVVEGLFNKPQIRVNNVKGLLLVEQFTNLILDNNDPPNLFRHKSTGKLVNALDGKLKEISVSRLDELLLSYSEPITMDKDGKASPAMVPVRIRDIVYTSPALDLPVIDGILNHPTLAPRGELVTEGHDAELQAIVLPTAVKPFAGPASDAAKLILDDLLGDFPFVDEASKANALALAILPIVRRYIQGSAPLHMVSAPVQRSGKSMLARCLLRITQGSAYTVELDTTRNSNENLIKQESLAMLRMGTPYLFYDDVGGKLESNFLNQILTSPAIRARIYGGADACEVEIRHTFVLTGNNLELSKDLVGRTAYIRLDPDSERPGLRKGFKINDLDGYVASHRPKLLGALLAIVQEWLAAGKPSCLSDIRMGGYENYVAVMGGILENAGVDGFLGNYRELEEQSDSDGPVWSAFFEGIANSVFPTGGGGKSVHVFRVKDVVEVAKDTEGMMLFLGSKDSAMGIKLGFALKSRVGRIHGGYKLCSAMNTNTRSFEYWLEPNPGTNKSTPRENLASNPGSTLATPRMEFDAENGNIPGSPGSLDICSHTCAHAHIHEDSEKLQGLPDLPGNEAENADLTPRKSDINLPGNGPNSQEKEGWHDF